jgi:hypothetical protein
LIAVERGPQAGGPGYPRSQSTDTCDTFWCGAQKFCVLDTGEIVSTYILTDARNALLFLAVTHIRYGMPQGETRRIRLIVARFS